MAYVAISNQLTYDVDRKIDQLKSTEVNALTRPDNHATVPTNDPYITALVWGEHLHLKDQMPDAWKTKASQIDVSFRVKRDHDSNMANFTFNTYGQDQFELPYASNRNGYSNMNITLTDEAQVPPIMQPILQWTIQRTDIESNWNGIKMQVNEFLKNCKSLNEALKLWPDLRIYIPKQYLDRMEKNSPSAKKAAEENAALKVLQSIDTDFVVAAAVGARLASAASGQNNS